MSESQKDVLYIDVEDDITSIIGKVKASKRKVIALVPPKRIGVLQSAVNLRLLARAAKQDDKNLVLITSNHALLALAAAASLPVAKNLQSKPELPEAPAADTDEAEDVINGDELSVGEHAKQASATKDKKDDAADEAITAGLAAVELEDAVAKASDGKKVAKKGKKKPTVPNFNTFRKKLLLIGCGVVLLIGLLVWAFVYAPKATVIIKAKTTSSSVNAPVSIAAGAETSFEAGTLAAAVQQQDEQKTVEFTATGQKDVGSKATGTVKFSNTSPNSATLPAGTQLTSNGLTYIVDSAVTIPGAQLSFNCPGYLCAGSTTGSVSAAENGSKYNAASGSLSGAPSGVSASFSGPTSGGVSKMVTVVTKADVDKAKESFNTQNVDAIKSALKAKFTDNAVAIDQSFVAEVGDVTSTPAIDAEATSGKATLGGKVSYKMYGVAKQDLKKFVEAYVKKDTGGLKNQRIYDDGTKSALFQEVAKVPNGAKATLVATAQVGPEIKDDDVKEQVKGQRYGEVQQTLQAIQGVESVDVKFFPFWVNSVPNDNNKISVEFKINGSN